MKHIEKYWLAFVIVFFIFMFINLALCMLLLGGLIFLVSIASLKKQASLSRKGLTANGKIRLYVKDSDGDSTPVVEFITPDGIYVCKQPFIYSSTDVEKFQSFKHLVDTEVSVLYNPLKPEEFVIANEKPWNDLILTLFAIASLILVGVAVAAFLGYIKLRH